jgi:CheY-like chemotaxis protein
MDATATGQAKARIAVIDDDAMFLELMRDLLAVGEGYDVVSTDRWLQSVEFVKQIRPDLIMLDLMLGRDQNGWAVLELLREDPSTARIPVIVCSAAVPALEQVVWPANGHGPVEAVAKPFDVDYLLEVIDRLLSGTNVPTRPN